MKPKVKSDYRWYWKVWFKSFYQDYGYFTGMNYLRHLLYGCPLWFNYQIWKPYTKFPVKAYKESKKEKRLIKFKDPIHSTHIGMSLDEVIKAIHRGEMPPFPKDN